MTMQVGGGGSGFHDIMNEGNLVSRGRVTPNNPDPLIPYKLKLITKVACKLKYSQLT